MKGSSYLVNISFWKVYACYGSESLSTYGGNKTEQDQAAFSMAWETAILDAVLCVTFHVQRESEANLYA